MTVTLLYPKRLAFNDPDRPDKYHCGRCSFSSDSLPRIRNHMIVHEIESCKNRVQNDPATSESEPSRRKTDVSVSDDSNSAYQNVGDVVKVEVEDPDLSGLWGLTYHLKSHDRVPPSRYQCQQCTYSTESSTSMVSHQRAHHRQRLANR